MLQRCSCYCKKGGSQPTGWQRAEVHGAGVRLACAMQWAQTRSGAPFVPSNPQKNAYL